MLLRELMSQLILLASRATPRLRNYSVTRLQALTDYRSFYDSRRSRRAVNHYTANLSIAREARRFAGS